MILVHAQTIRIERRNVYSRPERLRRERHGPEIFGDWYTIISACVNLKEAREAIKKLRARTNKDESDFRIVKRETSEKVIR